MLPERSSSLTTLACALPGRFQPFHNGHAEILMHAATLYERIIVAISNAHISHTAVDPFTGGERFQMIEAFAHSSGIGDRVIVVPVPVDDEPTTWVPVIRAICPPFDHVYTRSAWTESLFAYWGIANAPQLASEETNATATAVREAMGASGQWRALVPESVATVIDEIGGHERLRLLLNGRNHRLTTPS